MSGDSLNESTEAKTTSEQSLPRLLSTSMLARVHFAASFYVDGIFGLVSIPLNVLIVLVFCGSSQGTTRTTRIYYLVIASCELLTSVTRDVLVLFVGHGLLYISGGSVRAVVLNQSVWHCRVLDFVMFTVQMTCNYTYVALAAERCLALYFPFNAGRLISRRKATTGLSLIAGGSVLVCSGVLVGGSRLENRNALAIGCDFDLSSGAFISGLVGAMLLLTWFVSASIITVLNLLIVGRLVASAHARRRMSSVSSRRGSGSRKPCTRKAWQASVTLLLICGLHDVVLMPMAVCRTLPLFVGVADQWLVLLFYPFLSVNHVFNFVVFCHRVTGFRQNVLRLLHCAPLHTLHRRATRGNLSSSLSVSLHNSVRPHVERKISQSYSHSLQPELL